MLSSPTLIWKGIWIMAVRRIEMGIIRCPAADGALIPTSEKTRQRMADVFEKLEKGAKIIEHNEAKSWAKAKAQKYK